MNMHDAGSAFGRFRSFEEVQNPDSVVVGARLVAVAVYTATSLGA